MTPATETADRQYLRESVSRFMRADVDPIIAECESTGRFPRELLPQLAEFGYVGATLPEDRGGQGASYLDLALLMEEAGYTWMSLRSTLSVLNMVALILDRGGSAEHRERYLAPLMNGERLAWFGLSEPEHGSDVRSLDTTATRDGADAFRLNGTKLWITNGAIGDFGVLLADVRAADGSSEGLTAFLVDASEVEYEKRRVDTMFLKATTTSELVFKDARIPASAVLGEVGRGPSLFLAGLNIGRLNVALGAVGAARRALELSMEYARQRVQFGRPIGSFQLVQEMIADMHVQTSAARTLSYAAAELLDSDDGAGEQVECAVAKLYATETAFEVANKAVQVHGAMGLSREYGLERIFRDARGALIVEGTSQVQRLVIARSLLGISAIT
jgi:alkylation response protein AidB-like acyl-CoA dehydrogenase